MDFLKVERRISEWGNQGMSFYIESLFIFDLIKLKDTSMLTTEVGLFLSLTFFVKDF